MKNYVPSLFTFFEKIFTTRCLDVRFWNVLYFICLKFNPQYWYLLLRREKCADLVVIFNKKLLRHFYKIAKAVLAYDISHWFDQCLRFYTRCKIHRTPVLLKKYWFHKRLNRSNFAFVCFFSKKNFHIKKCLCLRHSAYLNSTSNIFTYLLIVFLGHDWFGFFLNKWDAVDPLCNDIILAQMIPLISN